jgi:regulator-associated protein of mTOR
MIVRAKTSRGAASRSATTASAVISGTAAKKAEEIRTFFVNAAGVNQFPRRQGGDTLEGVDGELREWRPPRDRMKTACVAIVVCLNVSVDPPDVIKTSPCARLECWIDPLSVPPQKALDQIGRQLQLQYERWQPRARYKTSLDPTVDEVKRLCASLRRNAKGERVLFHYNGHGVPRPTTNGEIWVFNPNYTQYIPLPVFDLQAWLGPPAIYVIDCSQAGQVLKALLDATQRKPTDDKLSVESGGDGAGTGAAGGGKDGSEAAGGPVRGESAAPRQNGEEVLCLAACGAGELLPMNPEYPADVFTTCLTTPIKMALRWHVSTHELIEGVTYEKLDNIPGRLTDRKSPNGELNWIFTAVRPTGLVLPARFLC